MWWPALKSHSWSPVWNVKCFIPSSLTDRRRSRDGRDSVGNDEEPGGVQEAETTGRAGAGRPGARHCPQQSRHDIICSRSRRRLCAERDCYEREPPGGCMHAETAHWCCLGSRQCGCVEPSTAPVAAMNTDCFAPHKRGYHVGFQDIGVDIETSRIVTHYHGVVPKVFQQKDSVL